MKVSTVMKSLKPYSPAHWLDELQTLFEKSCRNRTLPYGQETPLPHNTDIVRNTHCNDINTQKLELKAASLGIERTAWIFGADAEFLGLALREPEETGPFDPDPVLWFARIASRPDNPIEAQTAYLIDQFSDESLNRLASCAYGSPENQETTGDDAIRKRRKLLAQNTLFVLHNYDSGLADTELRLAKQQATRNNTSAGTAGFSAVQNYYAASSNGLDTTQKQLFNTMLNYRCIQNTGERIIDWNNGGHPEWLYDSMRELIANIRKTVRTIFNAQMTAHVVSSPFHETPPRLPPAAMRLFTRGKADSPEQKQGGIQL